MNDIAIRLQGVRKAFEGHVAVHELSLDVPKGCVFGLLGPNGAGKTTTLRMICLLYTSPSPRDRSLSRMPSSA